MRPAGVVACDVAVVGAGAAGLAAALRSAALGLRVALVTRGRPGGRLPRAERVAVLEGLPIGLTGEEVVERAVRQAERLGVRVVTGAAVALTGTADGLRRLTLDTGDRIEARAVIAATGAERETGQVEGAGRLLGAGVHTRTPRPGDVPAVGGDTFVAGDPAAAARVALALCGACERVTLVTAEGVARTLPPAVRAELRDRGNVASLPGAEVVGAEGVERLEVVVLRDTRTGRLGARAASSLWLVGAERARTEWLPPWLERDASGRVRTGGGSGRLPSETAMRRVFAAGDSRSGAPCGLAALEDGMDAAEQASARLRLDPGSAT